MPTAIKVQQLSKTFTSDGKKVKALDGVNLEIQEGEVLGILGPNGAGKTTFLNILATLLLPDEGTVEILGSKLVPQNFYRLRSLLNMSSGYPNFPWSLTVQENLRFYGRLYGLSTAALQKRIQELIVLFELEEFAKRKFEELSSGIKQRLSLAKAMLNDPKIIFLDEPTIGLDPDIAAKTREIILNIHKNSKVTVLLTTHNMHEAEAMCERIAFMKQGRIVHLAAPDELKRMHGKKDLEEVFIHVAQGRNKAENDVIAGPDVNRDEALPAGRQESSDERLRSPNFVRPRNDTVKEILFWVQRCLAFAYRNSLFATRNLFAFMELLFWPIVSVISIGLLGDFLQLQEKALAFVLTGAITAGVLQVTQLDVAYSLLYEVWSKSMKHTLLAPVGVSENLCGSWLVGILRGSAIFCILGVAAILLFGFQFPPLGVTIVFLLGIFCCAFLLGLLVSVLILLFGQKAEITAWMFAYIFMLLCGIYYPIDTLPPFFYNLAQAVPITYFLEYFRQSFGFSSNLPHLLAKGFALLIVYLGAGLFVMKFAFHQARKKGIIVKLSE